MDLNFQNYSDEEKQVVLPGLKPQPDLYGATNDTSKMVETWTGDDIPEDLQKSDIMRATWAMRSRSIKLTFLTPESLEDFELLGEIGMFILKMGIPEQDYDSDMMQQEEQIRMNFKSNLQRALVIGGKNERILEASSINQIVRTNEETLSAGKSQSGGGVFGWIKRAI